MSVSFDPELGEAIRASAAAQNISVSAWLAEAARERLRHDAVGEAIAAWEAEYGPLTEAELAEAASGCVAQAWRDGSRQAKLAGLLLGLTEVPLDQSASRAVGTVCAVTRTADVVDAHLALIARNHDVLATSDPGDLRTLLSAAGCSAEIVLC